MSSQQQQQQLEMRTSYWLSRGNEILKSRITPFQVIYYNSQNSLLYLNLPEITLQQSKLLYVPL